MTDFLVIGVDPAASKAAFVALYGNEFVMRSAQRLGKSGGQACFKATHAIESFVLALPWNVDHKFAYIEAPVVGRGGVRTTMVQCFTSGAIQGALHGLGFTTEIANVSSWKKRVVGKGNATKEQVAEHLRLRWPALYSAANGDQDLVDASCIAIFGSELAKSRLA